MGQESSPTLIETPNIKLEIEADNGLSQDLPSSQENIRKDSIGVTTKDDTLRLRSNEKSDATTPEDPDNPLDIVHNRSKRSIRIGITIFGIFLLVIGRLGVPELSVPCVEDRVLNALEFANNFILKPGNEVWRNFFQILCSVLVDLTCLITFINWIRRGTSYRLPLALMLFYAVRALVQAMWVSPFTTGYYWESPGLPSLVVPYGRGSDFFFSGHTGFMIICALELHYSGFNKKIRNLVILSAIYTMAILLVYRIHYSIDVFTGAFFAEWAFVKIDLYKDNIADKIGLGVHKVMWCIGGKYKPSLYKEV